MKLKDKLFALKPLNAKKRNNGYNRHLTAFDLVLLGVGAIIGAGIFLLTGKAAKNNAGPSVIVSFIIAGFISMLASLCYAEIASTLPYFGSAYNFTYATHGEFLAWINGWLLLLEYVAGAATVAVGWSEYLHTLAKDLTSDKYVWNEVWLKSPIVFIEAGVPFPWDASKTSPYSGFYGNRVPCSRDSTQFCDAIMNLPALVIVILCTIILAKGIKSTATVNNVLVIGKVLVLLVFILFGSFHIDPANYTPFIPEPTGVRGQYGYSGIVQATVSVFFSYIGFDAVTSAAYEADHPARDVPIGILGSLGASTVLYIGVAVVLTGMVNYKDIDASAPLAVAALRYNSQALAIFIDFGALFGLSSVLLATILSMPRILESMSHDGLLPHFLGKINTHTKTPVNATVFSGCVCAVLATLFPLDILGSLASVGTLFAFVLVSLATTSLRLTQPDLPRKFKIPGGLWVGGIIIPCLSASLSLMLILQAPTETILRVVIWMAFGILYYFLYGFHHSVYNKGTTNGHEDHELSII